MNGNGQSNGVIRFAVVDDYPRVAETLRVGLKRLGGFTLVAACATGREALEIISRLPPDQCPDLVLLEIRLKELDGYAVCRALRERWPKLLTAFHTTHRLPCFVNGARHAGADAYFCKPADLHQLAVVLRALHPTNGLLIDQQVLFGGLTGSYTLVREPRLSPRMEEIMELDAQGLGVKEIAAHFKVCPKIIYGQKQAALARIAAACRLATTAPPRGVKNSPYSTRLCYKLHPSMTAHADNLTKHRWFRALTTLGQALRRPRCASPMEESGTEPKPTTRARQHSQLSLVRTAFLIPCSFKIAIFLLSVDGLFGASYSIQGIFRWTTTYQGKDYQIGAYAFDILKGQGEAAQIFFCKFREH
jgi:two-component system, NarL family, nitrate/nitrite response regulator NarL